MNTTRWVIVVVALLIVVGLIAFARGRDHHRGDEVGAFGHGVHVQTVVLAYQGGSR